MRLAMLLIALALALAPPAGADARIEALEATLPTKAQAALKRIDGKGRRMLALRSYLRSERSLEARWSWSAEEIADYEKSPARQKALDAVAAVVKTFEEKNPGFTLYVNAEVRSLDEQIGKWNDNASVGAGAAELEKDFADWARDHAKAKEAAARAFLAGWKPDRRPMIAAPGLSPHGRAEAFDFQIMKDGAIIAAASTSIIDDVWEKDGWSARLKAAVEGSGQPFDGPLENPEEPWHYEYEADEPTRTAEENPPPVPTPRPSRDKARGAAHTAKR